jgi:hypothetical protein
MPYLRHDSCIFKISNLVRCEAQNKDEIKAQIFCAHEDYFFRNLSSLFSRNFHIFRD